MNVEYMKLNNKVFVTEEDGHVYEREDNDNIEKILDYENRLEVFESIIEEDEERLEFVAVCKKLLKKCIIGIPIVTFVAFPIFDVIAKTAHFNSLISTAIYFGSVAFTTVIAEGLCVFLINGCNKASSGLVNKLAKCYDEAKNLGQQLNKMKNKVNNKKCNLDCSNENSREPSFVKLDDSYNDEIIADLDFCYNQGVKNYLDDKKKVKVLKK